MEPDLISREEVAAMLFTIMDISVKLTLIIDLLEGETDGEEWSPEDDT